MKETKAIQERMSASFGLGNPINKEVSVTYIDDENTEKKTGSKVQVRIIVVAAIARCS